MNKVDNIWKFELPYIFNTRVKVEMPKHSQILTAQIDQRTGLPCIWAMVRENDEKVKRIFELRETGVGMSEISNEEHREYINTVQYFDMVEHYNVVLHIFEIKK